MAVTIDKMPQYDGIYEALEAAAKLYGDGAVETISFIVPKQHLPVIEAGLKRYGGRDGLLERIVECLSSEVK